MHAHEIRIPKVEIRKEFRNPKSEVLPPIRSVPPVADLFAGFLGGPNVASGFGGIRYSAFGFA